MTDAIQKARDAGITVIAASLDDTGTARQAFFGQDFVESGYMIGKRIVEVHGLGEGDFCVTPVEFAELSYAHDRYAGVKMALDEAGVESEMIGVGAVVEENQNLIAEYLVGNPDTDCIVGLGNVPTSVAPQAAEDAGMEGLPNGGFDVNPRIMENINAGLTTATVDQQPFLQGFLPVMFVALNQRLRHPAERPQHRCRHRRQIQRGCGHGLCGDISVARGPFRTRGIYRTVTSWA